MEASETEMAERPEEELALRRSVRGAVAAAAAWRQPSLDDGRRACAWARPRGRTSLSLSAAPRHTSAKRQRRARARCGCGCPLSAAHAPTEGRCRRRSHLTTLAAQVQRTWTARHGALAASASGSALDIALLGRATALKHDSDAAARCSAPKRIAGKSALRVSPKIALRTVQVLCLLGLLEQAQKQDSSATTARCAPLLRCRSRLLDEETAVRRPLGAAAAASARHTR
jgi:hypothetical protein